jgi:hypothetical protein
MSDPSEWIRLDYADYVARFHSLLLTGALPPWYEPIDFETWLSRQSLSYLRGHGSVNNPVY